MNNFDGQYLSVLVIEDNRDFAATLCMMFDVLGHQAVAAYNGIDGIVKAKEICPNIIFCDIGLPEMNGYLVAEEVRKIEDLKDVYLIALSGYAQPKDIVLSQNFGFNCHVAKPVDMSTMEQVLKEYCKKTPSVSSPSGMKFICCSHRE